VKRNEKKKEAGESSSLSSGEGGELRGDGSGSLDDDLPTSPPKLAFKHEMYLTPAPSGIGFGDDLMFEEAAGQEAKGKVCTLDESITRYTRFDSVSEPSQIVERIAGVVRSMGGKYSIKPEFKVKAQFGQKIFVAQVFTNPKMDSQVVVDFRKKGGSAVEFRDLYQDIRAQLADLVLQPKELAEV